MRGSGKVIAAALLAIICVSASPALAGPTCRRWVFQNQTFSLNQSNGYVLRITFGQPTSGDGRVEFPNGQISIERGGAGDFIGSPRFVPGTGTLVFLVNWRPPAGSKSVNRGTYTGEPRNIRPMGDGGLVADLHGLTFGENIPETTLLDWQFNPFHELLPRNEATRTEARASWTAPARIGCRPEDVLPDGVTAKDQVVARRAAEAAAAPPPRPVRSTGRPKPVSGPSVAHRLAFTGAWDTTVEGGIGYQLILQPQGNNNGIGPSGIEVPLEVVGTFLYNRFGDIAVKPGEHSNNGNLRGVIAPYARTLVFTYVQHNGSAGSGSFMLSDDGQSITGSIENSGGKSTWNGTRAK